MALKFFAVAALMAAGAARGEVVGAIPAPVLAKISDATYDPLPQYYFGYNVQDALTGDSKSQIESRNGGVVVGQYSLNDPDGTRRIVDYTSDSINGFNAVVRKVPLALAAPVVARAAASPVVAKALAAPLAVKAAAPPAEVKAAPLAKAAQVAEAAPAPPVAKAAPAPVVQESESVAAKSTSETGQAVASPPAAALAPVAYTASAIAYTGFAAPLAITLW